MDKATAFSCREEVLFPTPLDGAAAEAKLRQFVISIGAQLACGGIILGHIKILAKITEGEKFLFLSMTRLGEVDVKHSLEGGFGSIGRCSRMEVTINVLIIGRSIAEIEKAVGSAMGRLGLES